MSSFCVSVLLLLCAQDGVKLTPPPSGKTDAAAELKAATSKAASAGSYAYVSNSETSGGGFGGGGGGAGGGRGGGSSSPTTGKVEIGKHAEFKRDETLAYKIGDKLVYKKGEAWETYTPPQPGGGGAGGGAGGGGRGDFGGGRGGGGGREGFLLWRFANSPLPHELLNGLETKVKNVVATKADGKTTYTATLTEDGAKDLSGARNWGGGGGGGAGAGGGGFEFTVTGTTTLVVGAEGKVEQLVIETKTSSQRGDMTTKRIYTFKDWGTTKVEVPKEASAKVTS